MCLLCKNVHKTAKCVRAGGSRVQLEPQQDTAGEQLDRQSLPVPKPWETTLALQRPDPSPLQLAGILPLSLMERILGHLLASCKCSGLSPSAPLCSPGCSGGSLGLCEAGCWAARCCASVPHNQHIAG